MLAAQRTGNTILLLALDTLVIAAACVVSYFLRFSDFDGLKVHEAHRLDHLILFGSLIATWFGILAVFGRYRLEELGSRRSLLPSVAGLVPIVGVLVATALFLTQAKLASRLVFAYALVLSATGLWLTRAAVIAIKRRTRPDGIHVLIAGSGPLAEELGAYIKGHPELGYRLGGFLLHRSTTGKLPTPFLGYTDEISSLLDGAVIDQVVIAAPITELGSFESLIESCEEVGIDVSVAAMGLSPRLARITVGELGATPMLRLAASPQFRAAMVGKRFFDVVVASALLVLASPLFIATMLAVRLSSKGPLFFVQKRVGLNGRVFPFLKFRTMVDGAHALRGNLQSDVGPPIFKMRADPRVTRVGGFLRRFSLDELPQLVNVLRGEMSLVGPRPPLPEEVTQYDRWQRRRLSVRPGITCTWQVSGRSEIGFNEWMRLDLAYIDNWSPWLDLKILARTIPAVISRRGAA